MSVACTSCRVQMSARRASHEPLPNGNAPTRGYSRLDHVLSVGYNKPSPPAEVAAFRWPWDRDEEGEEAVRFRRDFRKTLRTSLPSDTLPRLLVRLMDSPSLNLFNLRLDGTDCKTLAPYLGFKGSDYELYMGRNQIGDDGAAALLAAMIANSEKGVAVLDLDLSYTGIGDVTATELAALLLRMPRMKVLRIEGNEITDKGATAIANAIKFNTLDELYMGDNFLTEDGAATVNTAARKRLRTNRPLKYQAYPVLPFEDERTRGR